jgi:hypothetical protein
MEHKVKKSLIPTEFLCNICNKFYASQSSLCHHNKKFHTSNVRDNVRDVRANVEDVRANVENNKNILQCEYCNKIFSSRSTKSEHKRKACKFKNNIINTTNNNTTINNNTNINNTNINNTNINNNNNNIIIKINNFGDEDLSHLTQKDITDMIKSGFGCVFDYIDKVHLNPNKPENHNIMLTNLRSGLIKIFQNYKWDVAKCNDILTTIIDKCYDLTSDKYNDLKDNKQFFCKGYEKWLATINNDPDKTYNDTYSDMKIKLYNK